MIVNRAFNITRTRLSKLLRFCGCNGNGIFRYKKTVIYSNVAQNLDCKYWFFPRTIRDLNDIPDSLISSTQSSVDYVLTSLVRARG